MDNFNRTQEDNSIAMPVPLANFNPQHPQNPIRVSAFSRAPPSSLLRTEPSSTDFNDNQHDLHLGTPNTPANPTSASSTPNVRYKECLKNHAASNGGHVLDGCCEFMPSSSDPLKCAACECHRSFHRKHSDGDSSSSSYYRSRDRVSVPLLLPPPHPTAVHPHHHIHSQHHQKQFNSTAGFPPSPSGVVLGSSSMVAFGGNNSGSGATTESSSEEGLNAGVCEPLSSHEAAPMSSGMSKKRFRTKFTAEQKEKMMALAEKLGWRFQRQDAAVVEQFCKETGIRRQVLKVWMHNNKHSMRKQHQEQLQHIIQNQQQQQVVLQQTQQQLQPQPMNDPVAQQPAPTAAEAWDTDLIPSLMIFIPSRPQECNDGTQT